jgi:hypothetical protein
MVSTIQNVTRMIMITWSILDDENEMMDMTMTMIIRMSNTDMIMQIIKVKMLMLFLLYWPSL